MNHPGYKSVLVKNHAFSSLQTIQGQKSYRHTGIDNNCISEIELPYRLDLKDIVTAFVEVGMAKDGFIDEVLKRAARNLTQYMNERISP
jgi:hypothetical protein